MSEMNFLQGLLQNGLVIAVISWLIKTLVSDKLKTINDQLQRLQAGREADFGKIQHLEVRQAENSGKVKALDDRVRVVETRCGLNPAWPMVERRCDVHSDGEA